MLTGSPTGNGMGGAAAVLPSADPTATIANPGQLGIFSLDHVLSFAFYPSPARFLPGPAAFPGASCNTSAANLGLNLANFFSLPFPVAIGAGYSRSAVSFGPSLDTIPGPTGPFVLVPVGPYLQTESISLALGIDYYLRLGVGANFKRISYAPITFTTRTGLLSTAIFPPATDLGLLATLPLFGILEKADSPVEIAPGLRPLLDVSGSYTVSNIGDDVGYGLFWGRDPLPRSATVGVALTTGFTTTVGGSRLSLVSLSVLRQGETSLGQTLPDGSVHYLTGAGPIKFYENVVAGNPTAQVLVRKGWQLEIAECLTLRRGSVSGMTYDFSTSGYSLSLAGLLRLLELGSPDLTADSWLSCLGNHFDLRYDASVYDQPNSPVSGSTFQALNVVVKDLPF